MIDDPRDHAPGEQLELPRFPHPLSPWSIQNAKGWRFYDAAKQELAGIIRAVQHGRPKR